MKQIFNYGYDVISLAGGRHLAFCGSHYLAVCGGAGGASATFVVTFVITFVHVFYVWRVYPRYSSLCFILSVFSLKFYCIFRILV